MSHFRLDGVSLIQSHVHNNLYNVKLYYLFRPIHKKNTTSFSKNLETRNDVCFTRDKEEMLFPLFTTIKPFLFPCFHPKLFMCSCSLHNIKYMYVQTILKVINVYVRILSGGMSKNKNICINQSK